MPAPLANPLTQVVLAAVLSAVGVYLLLPKPRRRWVAGGIALTTAGIAVFGAFLWTRFGQPIQAAGSQTDLIGSILFWLFATVAVGFGCVLVTQRNPARGAIAFAFVIMSACGLFLLLAAPFLMAATVIVYAGAIVVTFLFVLMLSHVKGPSDENDRTREPLLGSLAGFAFVGLLLFTLHASAAETTAAEPGGGHPLPGAPFSAAERMSLDTALANLDVAVSDEPNDESQRKVLNAGNAIDDVTRNKVVLVKGDPRPVGVLEMTKSDPRTEAFIQQTAAVVRANEAVLSNPSDRSAIAALRDQVLVYRGNGLLPARNVSNLGTVLYSEHLLAVEMAGTLLLVAAIGAVAIASRRKGVTA